MTFDDMKKALDKQYKMKQWEVFMRDPYVYKYSDVLKNLANIRDKKTLDKMEADYTCLRLAQIATDNPLFLWNR